MSLYLAVCCGIIARVLGRVVFVSGINHGLCCDESHRIPPSFVTLPLFRRNSNKMFAFKQTDQLLNVFFSAWAPSTSIFYWNVANELYICHISVEHFASVLGLDSLSDGICSLLKRGSNGCTSSNFVVFRSKMVDLAFVWLVEVVASAKQICSRCWAKPLGKTRC